MVKRLLTFALSVGFFIWLPNAFADGSGILSLDAPSHIRQTQNDAKALLTLRVDNIQVRAEWQVTSAVKVFDIHEGGLQTVTTVAPGIHVATIYAVDRFDLLNANYVNLTASAVITVEFVSGEFGLSDAPRLTAVAGEAVSLHTFVAEGGSGDKTYTLVVGGDGHFALDEASGVLSLRADAEPDIYTLTVEARDDAGDTAKAVATVEVSAVLTLATVPPLTVIVGRVAHALVAGGGIGTPTYAIVSGNKDGFALDAASGVLSLSVNAELRRHTLTVQVMDARDNTAQATVMVEVSAALTLAEVSSFTVIASMAMSLRTFIASGGIGTPTYEIVSGNEKEGFTLNAASGVLSLVANAEPDIYVLRIQAMDTRANTAETVVTVGVSAILSLSEVPSFTVIASVATSLHRFIASGGIGGRTYTLLVGEEDYFSVDAGSGVLSLSMNAEVGRHTLTVQVMDGRDNTAEAVATVGVSAALELAEVSSFTVIASAAMSLHMFIASGGIGGRTYTLLVGEEDYFSVDAGSGVLSLSMNAEVGRHTLTVQVMDGRDNTAEAVATVGVSAALELAEVSSFTVIASAAMSLHMFIASGGIGGRTYTLLVGEEDYFSVDAGSGVLSLSMNAEVGRHTLTVQVMDGRDNTAEAVATVGVSAALELAEVSSFTVIASAAMSLHMFIASGGIGIKTYTLLAGNDGYFSVDAGSGVLSLSSSASAGEYTLTVRVMDERGNAVAAVAVVNIAAALSLADAPPLDAEGEARDLHTFVASGGLGVKTYTLVAGAAYFTVDAASGVLSVNASVMVGIYTLSVQAEDAGGNVALALATVEVVFLFLLDAPMLYAIVGQEVSLHTFEADGGSGAKVFTIVAGNEDKYFTLDANIGVLSVQGNASVGIYTLSVEAKDEDGNQAEALVVVAVEASLFLADMPSLVAFTEITLSLHTFAASGGIGVKTYILSAGEGQEYFTLNVTSGVLSAVNAAAGVYTLSVTVSDSRGNSAQARGTVEVVAFLSLADAPPSLEALARLSLTVTLHIFAASGGYEAKRYTVIAGNKAGYFALDAASGELSLPSNSAMLAGAYTLRVEVSDSLASPQRATAAATVRIIKNGIFVLGGYAGSNKNDVWWSADGEAWNREPANAGWTARSDHQAVVHNGRLYVLGGHAGISFTRNDEVWWSVDGKNWVSEGTAGWSGRGWHQAVEYQGLLYVLGGRSPGPSNEVWSSADGKSWAKTNAAWTARYAFQAVVHNGLLYVLGGNDGSNKNDVWSSADGANWRFEGNADWGVREYHQAVSHMGRLYILGGNDGYDRNDVWSSLDGKSWRQEKANNNDFWSRRNNFQALSRDGLLYVLGGRNSGGNENKEVWSSADGKSWAKVSDADWSARDGHQAVVLPPPLVLSGSSETITLTLQAGLEIYPFSAQYGGGQYTYSLPPEIVGFNIDGAGVLSADNQAQAGAYALTVRVEDEEGSHAESIINIELRVLALADAPPLFAVAGLSESVSLHAFTVSHGIGAYTYDLVGGDSGYFTLGDASGVLSVSANVSVGIYTLSVAVSDEGGNQAAAVATVEVLPMLSLADAPLLSVVAGKALELHTFTAVGGIKAKTYNLVDEKGYFTLGASSGILSVQAVSEVGIYTVSVEVSDSVGNQATAQATVGVTARLSLAGASLMAVEKKAVSLHTFVASGGIGARTYTLSVGNETGYFVLDAASGVLSLSASASAGEYTLTVGVKDERSNIAVAVATVNISAGLSLADVPQLLFVAEGEAAHLHTFVASGGLGVKTYTVAAGAGYFTIGAASGVLSVDANAPVGIYTLSVQAADTDGNVVQALATAQVVSLLLADVMLYAIVGREVSLHTFEAGGGDGAKTYTIVAGNEGKYFMLDAVGVLSVQGSVTVGVYTLSVAVDDEGGNRSEAVALVAVEASLFLADAPPLTVMAGLALSLHTFAASDGIGVKTYTIAAGNEAGYFTLNAASGVLSLRVTAPEGFHTLTVQAADEYNNLAEAVATVDVSAALSLADASLLVAVAGMTMSVHTFAASGGIGAKTYTLVADNGAGYFAINATSGVLSVASATVGVYTLSVKVSDSRGSSVQARGTVQVSPPMSLADAPPLEALARLSVTVTLHTFVASDGYEAKRYTVIAGNKSGYFALDAGSGELSLPGNSAMPAGVYILQVEVSDSLASPQRATAAATVRIIKNGIFVLGGTDSILKNDVWWSADGEAWKQETANAGWTVRAVYQAAAYQGRLYVLGGWAGEFRNDVWSSADGETWRQDKANNNAGWSARGYHQALVHNGRMYVLGGWDTDTGRTNDVWSSADGETWRQDKANNNAGWPARDRHQALVHNGRMYVMGGWVVTVRARDVWSSTDGSSWRFEGDAAWEPRHFHQAVSHMGRLYILGGNDGNNRNDVWSSLDGKSWRQEKGNNNDFWSKRSRFQALSRDGLLYVLGGDSSGSYKKDVWSSADGKSWSKVADAAWSARRGLQAVVLPPNLVLSGTSETIILTLQAAAVALHTLSAQYGGGQYAYALPPEIEGINIDGAGVLSADNQAQAGAYEVTVRVEDEEGSHAETIINIELRVLALADVPPLFAVAGLSEAVSLHAFTAIYGIGASTYNLVDDSGYFTLGDASGVLLVQANVTVGVYTLSVEVSDESGNQATAVATVEAVLMLSLADAPPLTVTAGLTVSVHTFAASGGIGAKIYTLSAGNGAEYFAINATSGVLSVVNAAVGGYTLTVQVEDEGGSQAETVVQVEIVAASTAALSAVERFAWSGSGGNRNDVGLSEHGGSWRREGEGLRRSPQAIRYQEYVLDGG